jgi:hypothetical protein
MPWFDVLLLVIFGGVTYCVAGEGAWGAAITCLSVILSGLIAMNFFEPICDNLMGSNSYWQARLDLIVLVGLFAAGVSGLRFGADYFSPTYIGVHRLVHAGARWGCAALTGYVTMAFLLTALHTSALPREFMGFTPERANFISLAPDRQWLGFMQWVSENVCHSSPPRIFDGPRITLGGPATKDEVQNRIWPSFPIRYASRREKGSGGGGVAAPLAPARQVAPPPKQGGGGF